MANSSTTLLAHYTRSFCYLPTTFDVYPTRILTLTRIHILRYCTFDLAAYISTYRTPPTLVSLASICILAFEVVVPVSVNSVRRS